MVPPWLKWLCLICIAILPLSGVALAQDTADLRISSYEAIWQTVHEQHYDSTFGGLDWTAIHDKYYDLVKHANDETGFLEIANRMLGELGLSHYSVFRAEPDGPSTGTVGLETRLLDGKAVITTIREGYPAAKAGLREGYIVEAVGDGRSAVEIARRLKPDLIVLDLMLPELDGFEVARILRKEMTTAILMLTARDDEIDRVVGLEVGADDYLTKPFSMRELMARVKAQLRRTRMLREEQAESATRVKGDKTATDAAARAFMQIHVDFPAHPLGAEAGKRAALLAPARANEASASAPTPSERLQRAATLSKGRHWQEALDELALLPASLPPELAVQRDLGVERPLGFQHRVGRCHAQRTQCDLQFQHRLGRLLHRYGRTDRDHGREVTASCPEPSRR